MLIVGYCFGIRSERRLCEEVHLNLAYRWFCRLGLEDQVPDHSTFSKNRHGRFRDSDTLRFVFEQVLERCVREGLVGGEGFAIDASLVKADANRQRGVPGAEADWSDGQSIGRPVREYLAALDQAELETSTPKNISLTDPAARWSAACGPAFYAYSANYLVDIAAGIVVDVEATPAYKTDEIKATRTMIDRVETRFDLKPQRLIGDTNYGTAEILGWMVEEKRSSRMCRCGTRQNATTRRYPAATSSGTKRPTNTAARRATHCAANGAHSRTCVPTSPRPTPSSIDASQPDCATCPMKARCCPNTPVRKIARSVHESARDVARDVAKTDGYKQSRKDRKKVEMLFAHLKRILKLDRLRLRGLSGANDEFLLAATAQNLRRMAKWLFPVEPETAKMAI